MDTRVRSYYHLRMKLLQKLFGKRSEEVRFSYEEKRYPLGVLVLIFVMTMVLWMLGQRALHDVSDGIPTIPYPRYNELAEEKAANDYWIQALQPLQKKQALLERRIAEVRGEYDSSLLENIAGEDKRLYGEEEDVRQNFATLQLELENVQTQVALADLQYKDLLQKTEEARKASDAEYRNKNKWRQARVFLWEALFWVPFFLLTLLWHTRSRRKDSKWEVISLSSFIAASLLALQSFCTLLWSWIPRELLERLWELLSATLLTRILGYYILVGLAILLFGSFIVFLIRRMTDVARKGRKNIRQGGCPHCNYPLQLCHNYCGSCGTQMKNSCTSCKQSKYTWEAVCSHCGAK